jgi:hypothetical protein
MVNNMNKFNTSDLSLAAYLSMMGLKLFKAEKDTNNKFNFIFEDPNFLAPSFAVSFLNSDFSKYDNHLRNLKKMLYIK